MSQKDLLLFQAQLKKLVAMVDEEVINRNTAEMIEMTSVKVFTTVMTPLNQSSQTSQSQDMTSAHASNNISKSQDIDRDVNRGETKP